LYSSRHNFLVAVHTIVIETNACSANRAGDFQGKCFNLAPVLSNFLLVSRVFCLIYFLSKKHPVEHTFFTNLKAVDETVSWIPGYLQQNILLHNLYDLIFHISIIQKYPLFNYTFHNFSSLLLIRTQNRFLNILSEWKHRGNWYVLQ
jgi:hypothetical protein